jgi:trehalose/maltose hydrolase-like predicted phosphorylase
MTALTHCAVQYAVAPQDQSSVWLNSTAWPLLEGIADFWMSKLAIDNPGTFTTGGPLSIQNVIPPDEYADHKNDSVFTNAGAIYTLQYAARVAELLGQGSAAEIAKWKDAASRISVVFDEALGYHPECVVCVCMYVRGAGGGGGGGGVGGEGAGLAGEPPTPC